MFYTTSKCEIKTTLDSDNLPINPCEDAVVCRFDDVYFKKPSRGKIKNPITFSEIIR